MSEQVYRDVTDDEVLEVLLWHEQMAEYDKRYALNAAKREGLAQGMEQGITALILDNLEEGKTKEQILAKLKKRFDLNEEKALEYYQKYNQE